MSPEQLAGNELSTRSDIYSLGLVLYEVFTGKKVFDAPTLGKLFDLRRNSAPTSPSSLVPNLDPLIERVLMRCLEEDPDARPPSALQVAAALPGGDPLAAALAAGETPSPEAVAAAPTKGLLSPGLVFSCLGVVIVLLSGIIFFNGRESFENVVPTDKSPEVLADRAIELNRKLGYTATPADSAQSCYWSQDVVDYIQSQDHSRNRWQVLRNGDLAALVCWYRQSPRFLMPFNGLTVSQNDPPLEVSGMTNVVLDTRGHLQSFTAMPRQVEETQTTQNKIDWSVLFTEAGLDISQFREGEPRWTPARYSDARSAWDGELSGPPKIPIHIEAASFHGKVVSFEILGPWNRPARQEETVLSLRGRLQNWLIIAILLASVIGAAFLAHRNIRRGLGDRNGAFRLSLFTLITGTLTSVLSAHHVPILVGEYYILRQTISSSLLSTISIWLLYLAVEPFVRKRWPHRIISWKRFLSGEFRDPLVGRDLLMGVLAGIAMEATIVVWAIAPKVFGWAPPAWTTNASGLSGFRIQLAQLFLSAWRGPYAAVISLFFLFLLSVVLRREWLAIIVGLIFGTLIAYLPGEHPLFDLLFSAAVSAIYLFGVVRFGLLTAAFTVFTFFLVDGLSLTFNLSKWFASSTILVFVVVVGLASYAAYVCLKSDGLPRRLVPN